MLLSFFIALPALKLLIVLDSSWGRKPGGKIYPSCITITHIETENVGKTVFKTFGTVASLQIVAGVEEPGETPCFSSVGSRFCKVACHVRLPVVFHPKRKFFSIHDSLDVCSCFMPTMACFRLSAFQIFGRQRRLQQHG